LAKLHRNGEACDSFDEDPVHSVTSALELGGERR